MESLQNISYWSSLLPKDLPVALEPSPLQNVYDLLETAASQAGQLPAFTHEGQSLSFAQLAKKSLGLSRYLIGECGLKPGDRVMVQLPNTLAFPVLSFAILRAGLILVPCNPMYTRFELEKIIADAKPALVVTIRPNMNLFQGLSLPILYSDIYDFHSPTKRWGAKLVLRQRYGKVLKDTIPITKAIRQGSKLPELGYKPVADDIALLQYTGGSTGVLKGAKISHGNLLSNIQQLLGYLGSNLRYQKETVLGLLPMYHIFSFTIHNLMSVATQNHTVLVLNPLDLKKTLEEMKHWKFTVISGVNTLFHNLMKGSEFKDVNFNYLHLTISGGMALSKDVSKLWWKKTGCPILEGFGMSETSPVVSLNHPKYNQLETVGYPLPGTEIRLIDQVGNLINSPNVRGELEVRGPQVCSGYWQNQDEDRQQFSQDGWFRSGDLAIFTHTGHLKIVGRKKHMIIVSGFNVYPTEVESVLRLHPEIVDCHVIGVPHKVTGETVKAIVSTKSENIDVPGLKNFCRQHLTAYKVPRMIERR